MSLISEVSYDYDKEKVNKLLQEYYNGNKYLEDELILYNYPLVKKMVNTSNIYNYYDNEELESEGLIGLIYAIRYYNPTLGYTFSTYAGKCIKNRIINFIDKHPITLNEVSLDDIITGTEDVTLGEIIPDKEDKIDNYLTKDYVNSIFLNIPEEYRKMAYEYFVQDIPVSILKKTYNYTPNQFIVIFNKCKSILIKAIEEIRLNDKDIIIKRYNELDDKVRKCLLLYFQGYTYDEIARQLNYQSISFLIKKGKDHINYPIERIKEVILNNDIEKKEDPNKELFILNAILNMNKNLRTCLLLNLKGYNLKDIANIIGKKHETTRTLFSRAIRSIGYTKTEIIDVLNKYHILDNYSQDEKSILDTAKMFFKTLNNYPEEYIDEIINKFYNLPIKTQECIIDYINKLSNEEMVNKHELNVPGKVKRDVENKISKLGATTEELRYCLAKRI